MRENANKFDKDICVPNKKENDMEIKIYEMKDGTRVFFNYDENGIGNISVEAMDMLMEMIGAKEIIDDSNT